MTNTLFYIVQITNDDETYLLTTGKGNVIQYKTAELAEKKASEYVKPFKNNKHNPEGYNILKVSLANTTKH